MNDIEMCKIVEGLLLSSNEAWAEVEKLEDARDLKKNEAAQAVKKACQVIDQYVQEAYGSPAREIVPIINNNKITGFKLVYNGRTGPRPLRIEVLDE